jgi:hypothetical protein
MDVTAAHIWPARARSSLALLFGLSVEDLDSYRNGILMAASLEKQFDAQRVAFSYDFIHDTFSFHVLDPKLKNETPKGLIETFGRLEGRQLQRTVCCTSVFRQHCIRHMSHLQRHYNIQ